MSELEVYKPHLPIMPGASNPSAGPVVHTMQRLSSRAIGHFSPTSWKRAVLRGQQKQLIRHHEIVCPAGVSTTIFGQEKAYLSDFSEDSRYVYSRLIELLDEVTNIMQGDFDGLGANDFPELFLRCQPYLQWDAAVDLFLADKLITHIDSKRIRQRNRLQELLNDPQTIPGVSELRERVLYLIESLEAIYDAVLHLQVAQRLKESSLIIPGYLDIVNWFRSYAESLETLATTKQLEPPKSRFRRWIEG